MNSISTPFKSKEVPEEVADAIRADAARKRAQANLRSKQNNIRKLAVPMGYKVKLDEPLSEVNGYVDISLNGNKKRIACEITVVTPNKWRVLNI